MSAQKRRAADVSNENTPFDSARPRASSTQPPSKQRRQGSPGSAVSEPVQRARGLQQSMALRYRDPFPGVPPVSGQVSEAHTAIRQLSIAPGNTNNTAGVSGPRRMGSVPTIEAHTSRPSGGT